MKAGRLVDHIILLLGAAVMTGPVLLLIAQLDLRPAALAALVSEVWQSGAGGSALGAGTMLWNSLLLAFGVAAIKCGASFAAACALVYWRLPGREWIYAVILLSMFFPIETRILPTFAVTHQLGLLNSHWGMILPITASGLGVLVFRQALQQIPIEIIHAARIDGAGPLRIIVDIVVPLTAPMIGALFAILFVLGWNQYVWPIMINTTSQEHDTLVRGIAYAGAGSKSGIVLALMALVPPVIPVVLLQRQLTRALTTELK
ncbi:sn-glycerol-3-phosphate transport system permease protein UgpE [Roseobacter cerasinus]|uniref:sn-glycerol-3-phosphate transport system permease protein UgpE n=1 Tax=Roseobacter cerasinus TaxID=2602289 RepID=A0A640VWP3_9RHOB|nr:carbohydrate ABC transporter permease [Roseobacter cerasinus]GFE51501.1 sn-glycerol-3-phosphate transport system permease protein UgpE [Roseobacter cerasinus]